jgi:hypothetical protein
MYQVPFNARLADPGMSFHDPLSGFDIFGSVVKEITVVTPKTEEWLRHGGLIKVDGEVTAPPPAPVSAPETSTQIAAEAPAAASTPAAEEEAPSSLEALLARSGGDEEEEDAPMTSSKKTKKS